MSSSSMYPPIVEAMTPVITMRDTELRIYFSLSYYQSITPIKHVQVICKYNNNNKNAFTDTVANNILICSINENNGESDKGNYYITIPVSLINNWTEGVYLKFQLRFSAVEWVGSSTGVTMSWINSNLDSFSEWSTITLVKRIGDISFEVPELDDRERASQRISLASNFILSYHPGNSGESLNSWKMIIYDDEGLETLYDSGYQLFNNDSYLLSELADTIKVEAIGTYRFKDNTRYRIKFYLKTSGGYIMESEVYQFKTTVPADRSIQANLEVTPLPEHGYIKVEITPNDLSSSVNCSLILVRTDEHSNFEDWEDLGGKTFIGELPYWTFYDYTAEAGIYYKYGFQVVTTNRFRGVLVKSPLVILEFDNAFLFEKEQHLTLAYDCEISSFKRQIYEQKYETIGSKFATIIRNGDINYRTFQISGTISYHIDEDTHIFTKDSITFNNQEGNWNSYRLQDMQYHSYDYTYERKFREQVISFLCNEKIKLFKSIQEGNILVKLDATSVNFTPKQELSRLIYQFSATVYEVDTCNLPNYIKYNILDEPWDSITEIMDAKIKMGRINGVGKDKIKANQNITGLINEKEHYNKTQNNGMKVTKLTITYLRVEYEDDGYPIYINGDYVKPLTDSELLSTDKNYVIMGHILYIGDKVIVTPNPRTIYEIEASSYELSNATIIKTPVAAEMMIDYVVAIEEEQDHGQVASNFIYKRAVGQLDNAYSPADDLYRILYSKYYIKKELYYEELRSIISCTIEAEEGTKIDVVFSNQEQSTMYIGPTCELTIDPENIEITIQSIKVTNKDPNITYTPILFNYYVQLVRGELV